MIYLYEVEFKARNRATGENRLVTTKEHAYNVVEAVQQTTLNYIGEHGSSWDLTLVRVGPPREDVMRASVVMEAQLSALTAKLGEVVLTKEKK